MQADRPGSEIGIVHGGDRLVGYLATPIIGEGRGIVVIHEAFGLVPHIRDVCDRLAREGFVALAPDLYRGRTAADAAGAARLLGDLDLPWALTAIEAAVRELRNRDTIGGSVGVLGFCLGGQLALAAGCSLERIGAVADFYGTGPWPSPDFARCRAPVLAIFAENDAFATSAAVAELTTSLESAGVAATVRTIPAVEHGFMNDSRPDVYAAAAAAEGWSSLLSFFRAELA